MNPDARSNPQIPPALRTAPPRTVRLRPGAAFRIIGRRLFFVPHILVGIAGLIWVVGEPWLIWGTTPLAGRVTMIERRFAKGRTEFKIGYSYSRDGQTIDDSQNFTERGYEQWQSGAAVKVHAISMGAYHFSELEMSPGNYARSRWFIWVFVVIWDGMLVVFYLIGQGPKRLVRNGEPIIGKIVDKRTQRGRRIRCELIYEYAPPSGEAIRQGMMVPRRAYDAVPIGQNVTVLYDPNRMRRSMIYDYCDYMAM